MTDREKPCPHCGQPCGYRAQKCHTCRNDSLDPVMVRRLVDGAGDVDDATHRERRLAARLLTFRGYTSASIAARLGVTERTVERYRRLERQHQ